MEKKEIIKILRGYKKDFAKQYGILSIGIKNDLEKKLHRPIDIVTYRESMNQFLKKRIDGEAVYA